MNKENIKKYKANLQDFLYAGLKKEVRNKVFILDCLAIGLSFLGLFIGVLFSTFNIIILSMFIVSLCCMFRSSYIKNNNKKNINKERK